MTINRFAHELLGSDLRSIGRVNDVVKLVTDQKSFDELFNLVFHKERLLVMRAVDAVEKITIKNQHYLAPHKNQLLGILKSADHKELKWHIAQLVTRLELNKSELADVWHILTYWTLNKNESKIVRVNSLQGLFDLSKQYPRLRPEFMGVLVQVERENIPSLQSRIRKIKGLMNRTSTGHSRGKGITLHIPKGTRV